MYGNKKDYGKHIYQPQSSDLMSQFNLFQVLIEGEIDDVQKVACCQIM